MPTSLTKDIVFALVVGKYVLKFLTHLKAFGILGSALKVYAFIKIVQRTLIIETVCICEAIRSWHRSKSAKAD
jgi:hypothetical protein